MSCLFCSSSNTFNSNLPETLFNGKVFRSLRCADCNLIFLDPIPDNGDLTEMYPSTYQGEIILQKSDISKKMPGLRFSYEHQLNLINRFNPAKENMLDFGCGNGHFIYNASLHGVNMQGVEFSHDIVSSLKRAFPDHVFYTIEEFFGQQNKYDLIRMSNVLEHFTNPADEFKALLNKLNEDGRILIEGPLEANRSLVNFFKWSYLKLRRSLNSDYHTTHAPTHIFYSNYKNQLSFFEASGLKTELYRVKENAWPYHENFNEVKSFGGLVKFITAKVSIMLSWFYPCYGNTFIYVGKK